MVKNIFVNLPCKDLVKSKKFWSDCGFTFNPQFTNETGASLELSGKDGNIFVMLLTEDFFKTFIDKTITDSASQAEVINAISVESNDEVNALLEKVIAAGGKEHRETQDYGWMYSRAFQDIDGHNWEVLNMDFSKLPADGSVPVPE